MSDAEDRAVDALREKVLAATFDPGRFVPRGAWKYEPLPKWQARAVLAALDLPALLAEAWERGHFYRAAEQGADTRCANPYREPAPGEGARDE